MGFEIDELFIMRSNLIEAHNSRPFRDFANAASDQEVSGCKTSCSNSFLDGVHSDSLSEMQPISFPTIS